MTLFVLSVHLTGNHLFNIQLDYEPRLYCAISSTRSHIYIAEEFSHNIHIHSWDGEKLEQTIVVPGPDYKEKVFFLGFLWEDTLVAATGRNVGKLTDAVSKLHIYKIH